MLVFGYINTGVNNVYAGTQRLLQCLAAHIIHYTIEVGELLLHGKNANFVDLFWKNTSKGGG